MFNFNQFQNLSTSNLLLRRMVYNDINDLFHMRKDPRMNEHVDTKLDESIADTEAYINKMNKGIDENKWIIWAIEHKQSKKVIGSISIWNFNLEEKSGELGYGIIPDFQGLGFMKEALLEVIQYAFHELHLKFLYAYTEENNLSSIKLLEKCDFEKVNKVDEKGYFNDRIYRMLVFRLGRE